MTKILYYGIVSAALAVVAFEMLITGVVILCVVGKICP